MPDYMFLLESRLSPEQRAAMLRVQELAAVLGFNVYLTGGTVRDLITGANLRDLDLTNGLSDIEHGEVRALSIHSFTNQPVRLLRALRLAARMGFKLESRTQEWYNLAIERELHLTITPEDAGEEMRSLSREERPQLILKEWEEADMLERVHPMIAKKHPGYDAINHLIKVRDDLYMPAF